MTTPFDKFNSKGSTTGSSSFTNIYETYRQTYSNIDAQYSGLGSTGIFSYANQSSGESTTSKVMKGLSLGVSLLTGLASAGVGIAGAVMTSKAMKSAARGTTPGAQPTTDFKSMSEYDLAMKKSELTDKIYLLGKEAESAAHEKTKANELKNAAKKKADEADAAYGEAKKNKKTCDDKVVEFGKQKKALEDEKNALSQDQFTKQEPDPDNPGQFKTVPDVQAFEKAKQEKQKEIDAKQKEIEAEQKKADGFKKEMDDQEKIRKEQTEEFDKQSKEAIAKQKEETTKKNAKEAAETELKSLEAEEIRRATAKQKEDSKADKKKKK